MDTQQPAPERRARANGREAKRAARAARAGNSARGNTTLNRTTTPAPAFKVGEKSNDPLQMYLCDVFTISCNLAGICGLSLPCGFASDPKLPIGLQLLGKPFGESTLFRIAHAYEQSTPWHRDLSPLA